MARARSSPRSGQLPFVLQLLEDENPKVRRGVVRELRRYGIGLAPALQDLRPPASAHHRELLADLLHDHLGRLLLRQWQDLVTMSDSDQRLICALEAFSAYLDAFQPRHSVEFHLERLLSRWHQMSSSLEITQLPKLLPEFAGRARDAELPLSAFSLSAIAAGAPGHSWSRSLLLCLLARRAGLECTPCPLPGRLVLRLVQTNGEQVFWEIDRGGQPLSLESWIEQSALPRALCTSLTRADMPTDRLIESFLRVFLRAMRRQGNVREAALALRLLRCTTQPEPR